MKLVSGKFGVAQQRIPAAGVMADGAAVAAFEISTDVNGDPLPKGFKIKRMVTAHVDASNVAASSISEMILYNTYLKAAKDKHYEDAWSEFTEAATHKFDGTEIPYICLDGTQSIYGTARIKTGSTDAAIYLTVFFEAL